MHGGDDVGGFKNVKDGMDHFNFTSVNLEWWNFLEFRVVVEREVSTLHSGFKMVGEKWLLLAKKKKGHAALID